MAVAEKPTTKTSSQNPVQQLALVSFAGAAFVLFSLGLVLSGIPTLWQYWLGIDQAIQNDFLSTALVMMVSVAAAVGLVQLGRKLEGTNPLRGLRAGSIIAATLIFLIFVVVLDWIGGSMIHRGVEDFITWSVVAGLGIGSLVLVWLLFNRPGFAKFLVGLEESGWFHATSFKFNQGQKVRRATLIALLVVVGAGIYNNMRTELFGRGNWEIILPGELDWTLVVLYNVNYMMPLVLFGIFGWLSWRIVNWPKFADFLIATEAEINKVSWTTRKRLFQDTIVVLVTVTLLTIFLFVVDMLWIQVLRVPGVLQIDPTQAKQKQMGPTEW